MFWGSQKPQSKTVLIVDIESGSVGSALAHINNHEPAKLFGEWRTHLPVFSSRDSHSLLQRVLHSAGESIAHASEVAARLRLYQKTKDAGTFNQVSFFLAAPWGVPDLKEGKPAFLDSITRALHGYVRAHVGSVPISFNTHAGAVVRGMHTVLETNKPILVVSVHGEVTELVLLEGVKVLGHATIPHGHHSLLRTLRTHSGISEAEALSILRLGHHSHYQEPLSAGGQHFRELFRESGEPLFGGKSIEGVYVLGRGAEADFFARALSHDSLSDLFPNGGSVRTLRAHHFVPYVAAHAENPDTALLLSALFLD